MAKLRMLVDGRFGSLLACRVTENVPVLHYIRVRLWNGSDRKNHSAERIRAADPKHNPTTKTIERQPGTSRYDFCGFRGL